MANGILVVDDAAFMRMMIKDILAKNGFEVLGEAENGATRCGRFEGPFRRARIQDLRPASLCRSHAQKPPGKQ